MCFYVKRNRLLSFAVYASSIQALVSSGRDAGGLSPPATFRGAKGGSREFPNGHLPMAVLPQSLAEEAERLTALQQSQSLSECFCSSGGASAGIGSETAANVNEGGESDLEENTAVAADVVARDVADMMLSEGVLKILVDVMAPRIQSLEGWAEEGGGRLAVEAVLSEPPPSEIQDVIDAEKSRLEAFEAAVSILEGRPPALAEFIQLGGFARVSCLVHDVAETEQRLPPSPPVDADDSNDRSRSRSKSRTESVPRGKGGSEKGKLGSMETAFEAVFRLALDGQPALPGTRADGLGAVKTLLLLAAHSPSLLVSLRAGRSLQALLRIRPMNAVVLEQHDALQMFADAVADLAFLRCHEDSGESNGSTEPAGVTDTEIEVSLRGEETLAGRAGWSLQNKREALVCLNDLVRVIAAVYSRQDARAIEHYATIILPASTARFRVESCSVNQEMQCSSCELNTAACVPGSNFVRCLVEGCSGAAGLCVACDMAFHQKTSEESHIRVPTSAGKLCEDPCPFQGIRPHRMDPGWAVEAGKALLKAMSVMLDDRESFGLPPTPTSTASKGLLNSCLEGKSFHTTNRVLPMMLSIAQDELLGPLQAPLDNDKVDSKRNATGAHNDPAVKSPPSRFQSPADHDSSARNNCQTYCPGVTSHEVEDVCGAGWTGGWLLGALEVIARVVVRGDSSTMEDLGAAGGWGLLAHVSRLPSPPQHLCPDQTVAGINGSRDREGEREEEGDQPPTGGNSGERLCEVWVGWVGARRLSLWILREALLTGAGLCRNRDAAGAAAALTQPAKWLVWLVRGLVTKSGPACGASRIICPDSQVKYKLLTK